MTNHGSTAFLVLQTIFSERWLPSPTITVYHQAMNIFPNFASSATASILLMCTTDTIVRVLDS